MWFLQKGCGGVAGEPWAYDDEAEAISKTFINFRYRLLPYLYSAFYEATQTGMPIARSLAINYPYDDKVYDNAYQNQFLFGGSIMVVPVISTERSKKLYLPQGDWYNIYTDEKLSGQTAHVEEVPIYQLPVFIKGSSIIPLQGIVQSTKDSPSDTLQLHIYNGSEKSTFIYYEDEGDGFGYKSNIYCKKLMEFSPIAKKIIIEKQQGSFTSKFTKLQFVFHGFGNNLKTIKVNGTAVDLSETKEAVLLDGLANLAGIYDAGYYSTLKNNAVKMTQQGVVVKNTSDEILVEW